MARTQRVFKTTMLVTAVIILSKVFGFIRDMILANYFGTGMANDAYVSAYSLFYLPVLLFNSCISATLIPLYVQEREQQSLKHSNHFASNTINLFALAALVISALFYALARPLVRLIYVGFDPGKADLTVRLVRMMLLSLVFNITSISLASLLNAAEKYVAAQLTGFPLSLCVMAASVVFSGRYGIEAVGWGVFAANILQFLILIPFLRGWFHYTPVIDFLRQALPQAGGAGGPGDAVHGHQRAEPHDRPRAGLGAEPRRHLRHELRLPADHLPAGRADGAADHGHVLQDEPPGRREGPEGHAGGAAPVHTGDRAGGAAHRGHRRGDEHGRDQVRLHARALRHALGAGHRGHTGVLRGGRAGLRAARLFEPRVPRPAGHEDALPGLLPGGGAEHRTEPDPARFIGANGLALATSIAGTTGMCTLLVLLKKRFRRLGLGRILPDLLKIVAAALICAGVCLALNRALPPAMGTGRRVPAAGRLRRASPDRLCRCAASLRVKTLRTFAGEFAAEGG